MASSPAPTLCLGINTNASGSALFSCGSTTVVATVYGPRENSRAAGDFVTTGALEVRVQVAPFASRGRASLPTSVAQEEERQLEAALSAALLPSVLLERFPKAVVEVHVLVLSLAGGGELAAAVTASSAALVDAGVDVVGLVAGACVRLRRHAGSDAACVVLPLAGGDADAGGAVQGGGGDGDAEALLTLAYMPALQLTTLASHSGAVDGNDALRLFAAAMDACGAVAARVRPALETSARQRLAAS